MNTYNVLGPGVWLYRSGKELKLPWGVGRGGPRDLGSRTRLGSSFYKTWPAEGCIRDTVSP